MTQWAGRSPALSRRSDEQMGADNKPIPIKMVFQKTGDVPDEVRCSACQGLSSGGWCSVSDCGYCSNTRRVPIPFSEVWGLE